MFFVLSYVSLGTHLIWIVTYRRIRIMIEKAETLFHKLEEKLLALLAERDNLIRDKQRLTAESHELRAELQALKTEREVHAQKLNELVLLIEAVNEPRATPAPAANVVASNATAAPAASAEHFSPSLAAIKPFVAQGQV